MDQYTDIIAIISLVFGASWASGINLYATILTLGIMQATGYVDLPEQLDILSNPIVLVAAGLMYGLEFFADKIPGVDSMWDSVHTFIRIPMGAYMAYGVAGDQNLAIGIAAAIIGGGISTATHATKSGTRLVVNTSPEPFSNWFLSLSEDVAVILGLWAAVQNPILFLVLFVIFIAILIWLLPKVWRGVKNVFITLCKIVRKKESVKLTQNDTSNYR